MGHKGVGPAENDTHLIGGIIVVNMVRGNALSYATSQSNSRRGKMYLSLNRCPRKFNSEL